VQQAVQVEEEDRRNLVMASQDAFSETVVVSPILSKGHANETKGGAVLGKVTKKTDTI
jgi:hypothetical protein